MVHADLGELTAGPGRARDRLADEMAIVWAELVEPHWLRLRAALAEDTALPRAGPDTRCDTGEPILARICWRE
ncbi:hypothetical protein LWP59_39465 [Amycolatopsis acidiphila]|uniref:Uncharacterized protein n=2 Tax=Amycolatopsis acidiphila TaxID=715473 RepID=A0A558A2M1_9PSEU|nr:hypothetical protein [Amycolatopsis acidiphila]TVT18497.1 hypothetical protein FNH06_27750 [Amycolatopsis acidiphila]UIJ59990.1 hypothetical protein LWP59_39465 [Amycolatopsis acidiphila]GHG62020.1 hypothetical protein GCM10017788_17260 [Amycolatopsis acidiphila]